MEPGSAVPRRKDLAGPPKGFVVPGGTWPEGPFVEGAPPAIGVAAHISAQLRVAIAESRQSMTQVAAGLQVARTTVYDILNGTTFPDITTIANAQRYFNQELWPRYTRRRKGSVEHQ